MHRRHLPFPSTFFILLFLLTLCVFWPHALAGSDTRTLHWERGSEVCTISDNSGNHHSIMDVTPKTNHESFHVLMLSYSTSTAFDTGDCEIRIPAHIFKDREGNPVGQYTTGSSGEAFKFEESYDASTDEIVFKNFEPIPEGYFCNVSIEYNKIRPSEIKDGYQTQFEAKFLVKPVGGTQQTLTSNPTRLTYHTKADLNGVYKSTRDFTAHKVWRDKWGPKPADADDYVYIGWFAGVDAGFDDTQPYTLSISENEPAGPEYGEVIGYADDEYYRNYHAATREQLNAALKDFEKINFPNPPYGYTYNTKSKYVICRYKKADVLQPTSTPGQLRGVLKNRFTGILTARDGTVETKPAEASYTFTINPTPPPWTYGQDIITTYKFKNGMGVGLINDLEEDRNAPFDLPSGHADSRGIWRLEAYCTGWNLTKEGGRYGVHPYTLEMKDKPLRVGTQTLTPDDYELTSVQFYGVHKESGGEKPLQNNSTTELPPEQHAPLKLYVVRNGVETAWGELTRVGDKQYRYRAYDGSADITQTPTYQQLLTVPLPENTTSVVMRLTSAAPCKEILPVYIGTRLKRSEAMLKLIDKQSNLYIYNDLETRAYRDGMEGLFEKDSTHYIITRMHQYGRLDKTAGTPVNETGNARYYVDYKIVASGSTNTGVSKDYHKQTLEEAIGWARQKGFQERREGVFYDLLPPGSSVDLSTVATYRLTDSSASAGSANIIPHTAEVRRNWRGSGRDMLIVRATVPDSVSNYALWSIYENGYDHKLSTGMLLTFRLYNPWYNVADNGETLRNFVGFESPGIPFERSGYPDDGKSRTIDAVYRPCYEDVNGDGQQGDGAPKTFLYANHVLNYKPLMSAELKFNKKAFTPDDASLRDHAVVPAGGEYSYRIRSANSPITETKDMVLYDMLETAFPQDAPHWQGRLKSVDVSQPAALGIDAKIYYATQDPGPLVMADGSQHLDSNPALWQATPPGDLSQVKAVCIDLRHKADGSEFVLGREKSITVYLHMQAPVEAATYIQDGALAYNKASFANRKSHNNQAFDHELSLESCNTVTVGLKEAGLVTDKSADPATGTAQDPAPVPDGSPLAYSLSLDNVNDAQVIRDITLEDVVPEGLAIDRENIRVLFNGQPAQGTLLKDSDRVKLNAASAGQKLVFDIASLAAKEKLVIRIPTAVRADATRPETLVHDNQSVVTSVYGRPYHLKSNETHHRTPTCKAILEGVKTLRGRTLKAGEFTFELTDAGGTVLQTKTNRQDGLFTFDPLTFVRPGTYAYTVHEKAGGDRHIAYDAAVYTATLTVSADAQGNLSCDTRFSKSTGTAAGMLSFVNAYAEPGYAPVRVPVKAVKRLSGRALKADEFMFELTDKNGRVLQTKANGQDGEAVFDDIKINKPGIYVYTLREKEGNDRHVTYDTAVYTLSVTVQADAEDRLSCTAILAKDGQPYQGVPEFFNHAQPPQTGDSLPFAIIGLSSAALAMLAAGRALKKRRPEER